MKAVFGLLLAGFFFFAAQAFGADSQIQDMDTNLRNALNEKLESIIAPWRPNHSKGAMNLDIRYGTPQRAIDLNENGIALTFPRGPFKSRDEIAKNLVEIIDMMVNTYNKYNREINILGAFIFSHDNDGKKVFEGSAFYNIKNPKKIYFTIYPNNKKKFSGTAEFMRYPTRIIWD